MRRWELMVQLHIKTVVKSIQLVYYSSGSYDTVCAIGNDDALIWRLSISLTKWANEVMLMLRSNEVETRRANPSNFVIFLSGYAVCNIGPSLYKPSYSNLFSVISIFKATSSWYFH